MVKREDSQLSGCGFESWRCILDSCQRSITIEKLMKNTGSQMGHPKKKNYIKKKKKMRKYLLIIFFHVQSPPLNVITLTEL